MAGVDFDQLGQFQTSTKNANKIEFLSLRDDGDYARIRFMYGPEDRIQAQTIHKVKGSQFGPFGKSVCCLRTAPDQPLSVCPLCESGLKLDIKFYMPVFVEYVVTMVNGREEVQQVNAVRYLEKGPTFANQVKSILRSAERNQKPLIGCVFNIVRNGAANDQKTTYTVEFLECDNSTLQDFPPVTPIVGSNILPNYDYNTMVAKFLNGNDTTTQAQADARGIQPRGINMNTFAGNTVVTQAAPQPASQPQAQNFGGYAQNFNQPMNANQAPVQAPKIGNGNLPF